MSKASNTPVESSTAHEEMNLVEFPIGLIGDRPPRDPETGKEVKTFEWEKWISFPGGERVKQQWVVTGSDKYGLPRGFDFCVLFLMIQFWAEQGFRQKIVEIGSTYRMLKRMGLPDDPHYYNRIREALDRLIGTTYYTRFAIWNPKKRTYIPRLNFNILSRVQIDNSGQEEELEELAVCVPSGTVEFTDALLFLVRNGYFKPTDAGMYWSLPTPYSRRVFQFLDKRRANGKVQRFEVFSLAKKLGTHDLTLKGYKPAHIRKTAEPHLSRLTLEYGYLEHFGWPREGRRTYLEVCYAGEFPEERKLSGSALALMEEIVDAFDEEGSRRYYERVIAELGNERVRKLFEQTKQAWSTGTIKNPGAYFVSLSQPLRTVRATKGKTMSVIEACSLCNSNGMLELRERKNGRRFVHPCPHEWKLVTALLEQLGADRLSTQ
jgi:hypothetical protein